MFVTYFIGPAGSGKSTLTYAFAEWIRRASAESEISDNTSVACVNLDPGVRWTPYPPDVDVRDYVDYDEVVQQYNLGPNGALVAATDMIINHLEEIKEEIQDTRADFILVDTPGQIELFSFRAAGPKICTALGGEKKATCFMFEPTLASEPSGFISTFLLSSAVEYRFFLPQVNLLSKADILSEQQVQDIVSWSEDPYALSEAIELRTAGIEREKALKIATVFEDLGSISSLVPVSAKDEFGLDGLYAELSRIFKGGDDFDTEE